MPVRIMAFGGAARPFPYLKTSMVLTAVVTMYALRFLNPTTDVVSSQEVALIPPPDWVVPNHSVAIPPSEQRKQERMNKLHSAAEDHSSSSAAESSESSVSSEAVSSAAASSAPDDGIIPPAPVVEEVVRSDNKRGVFLTGASVAREKFFNDTIDDLLEAGGDTLVMDVKGGGVLFHSAAPQATQIGIVRNLYDLPAILENIIRQCPTNKYFISDVHKFFE
jgi:hypothetical protein